MATYFASRWLSPRLMTFMARAPGESACRLQPLVDLIDLETAHIDMAIRWGRGDWTDLEIEPLLPCPAFPVTAGAAIARNGYADTGYWKCCCHRLTLLHDRENSNGLGWIGTTAAGMPLRPSLRTVLSFPDPNVRVQAVIDGQGVQRFTMR